MSPEDLLYSLVALFEQLQVPYFITGSVAAMTYGETRFTNDVDIVAQLREEHVEVFCNAFQPPDYYLNRETVREAIRNRRQFNLLHITEGVKADIIIPKDSEFNQSRLQRCRPARVGSRGTANVASPEDVILKKLEYYREGLSEKHLRDIGGILQISSSIIDYTYISDWVVRLHLENQWQLFHNRSEEPASANSPSDD